MSNSNRYQFDLLYRHSNEMSLATRRQLKDQMATAKLSFTFLGQHFDRLSKQSKTHARNVKMALATRFINHVFSQIILTERGLLLDAANSSRSATETIAFYWLICKEPTFASLYDANESIRPVEVRKQLEKLGVDVSELRDQYGLESHIAHVGNQYDNLQIKWESNDDGTLLIGGALNIPMQQALLASVPYKTALLVMHEPGYVVKFESPGATVEIP